MTRADRLPAPALSGGVLGVVTTGIGISAHAAGGGALPHPGLTIGVGALVAWAGSAPAGRRRGPAATVAALTAGQAMLHVVLVLPPGLGHQHPPSGAGLLTMLAGHTTAVVLVGLLLAWTDTVVLAALRIVRGVLRRIRTTVPVHAPLWVAVVPAVARDGAKEVLLRRTRTRRGPPLFA
ncbi:hypothetical protein ACWED2_14335 [Amycolatopsis sp. NPDC005003]